MEGFGERLKMLREARGLSQSELAELSGVEQPTISNYETGKRTGIPLAHAMRLADALGFPLQFLAYGREWRKPEHSRGEPKRTAR